jgi:hypothetical protein
MNIWGKTWTQEELAMIASAINAFGSGGHPEASPDRGLDYFQPDYVRKCLRRAKPKNADMTARRDAIIAKLRGVR